jgi:lipopolysaccharide export system permease protein
VIKKLDKLIIKSFIGPFIVTFFITLFVLVMQFFWLYLDDLVGKGLDFFTIMQLIGYVSATLIPLALPLAVLLSSIMTFGNLGETFELVALKSSGIPLSRFMRPLFFLSLVVCGISFLLNNYVIPVATLKMNTLKYDIIVSKPAFDIKEGVFYDKIEGYVIKIGKKEKDGSTIRNVIIYERNQSLQDNIIVARSGKMSLSSDKKALEFNLRDGWLYQERGARITTNTEFIRLGFSNLKKEFDLSTFKLNKTSDSVFRDNYKMLSVRQLSKAMDSMKKNNKSFRERYARDISPTMNFARWKDTGWVKIDFKPDTAIKKVEQLIPDSAYRSVLERAITQVSTIKNTLEIYNVDFKNKERDRRYYAIEWHRKFALSMACLVLFLIGAPLGSIIRKGGIGTPMVFAVIFFVIFHLMNTFGEKIVKEGVWAAFYGMWLSALVLTPIGFFLTYKAMRDSNLMSREFYFRTFNKFRAFLYRTGILRKSKKETITKDTKTVKEDHQEQNEHTEQG